MRDVDLLTQLMVEFYERLSSWEQEVVKGSGLSLPQMHTLEVLGHHAPLRMKDLADRLGVTTGTMTVTIDKLEQLGLVARQPHESDRRSLMVVLTPQGHAVCSQHHNHHLRLTEELMAILNPEEIETLISVLTKALGIL